MKRTKVVVSAAAHDDIRQAVTFYLLEGSVSTAKAFIDALERTFQRVGTHPLAGSPRYAHELDLPGLRHLPVLWPPSHSQDGSDSP